MVRCNYEICKGRTEYIKCIKQLKTYGIHISCQWLKHDPLLNTPPQRYLYCIWIFRYWTWSFACIWFWVALFLQVFFFFFFLPRKLNCSNSWINTKNLIILLEKIYSVNMFLLELSFSSGWQHEVLKNLSFINFSFSNQVFKIQVKSKEICNAFKDRTS